MRAGGRGLILLSLGLGARLLAAQAPEPSPSPSFSPSPRPVTESIERVIDRIEQEQGDPCRIAREEGRPCFPVVTTQTGRTYSVRDRLAEVLGSPAPGPTGPNTDMGPNRPGTRSTVVPLVKFDPGCVGKTIFKKLKGRNDTYYLYRLRDVHGERVELADRKMEAETFQGELAFLGRFDGECDAIAAYRREQLRLGTPSPESVPARVRPSPSPSPGR
jgi:hypothetical protein